MVTANKKQGYKCCFTGYRPSKFPFSLDRNNKEYQKFDNALVEELSALSALGCHTFYSGMAMGFDIIAAETVLLLKQIYSYPLKLICVVPFSGQENTYTAYWRERYNRVLELCDGVEVLSDTYTPGCYQKRNIYMVDNSDFVLTWYDGKSGGTKNTIDYAARLGRQIFNINKAHDISVQTCFAEL
ncbi:MAG: DUF1273 family protein [Clostridia bacterium]|nr:DUF1273 family protein [Clostridia bacterium]